MSLVKQFISHNQLDQLMPVKPALEHLEKKLFCLPNYKFQLGAIESGSGDPMFYARYISHNKEFLVAGYDPKEDLMLVLIIYNDMAAWMYKRPSYFTALNHLVDFDLHWQPTKYSRVVDRKAMSLFFKDDWQKTLQQSKAL